MPTVSQQFNQVPKRIRAPERSPVINDDPPNSTSVPGWPMTPAWACGVPAGLVERLAAQNIHVAERGGTLRVSPHVYNDEADVDRFAEALAKSK